jgi:hypothetical protein
MMLPGALQHLYDRWRHQPFPPGSVIDELDLMHAQLAYADAMVADSAIPFVTRGEYSEIPDQAVRELDSVIVSARRLEENEADERAQLATQYREYAELLKALWEAIEGRLSFPAGISPVESTWVGCYGWRLT